MSPSPANGETAIRFDGVASMERIVVPVATPSAKWMQRKSAPRHSVVEPNFQHTSGMGEYFARAEREYIFGNTRT
jgi:hypothetical protein